MKIKALLLDFDGTLTSKDQLTEVIDLVGKKEESVLIDADFHSGKLPGLSALISRINLLSGVSTEQIVSKVKQDLCLIDGAVELINYCKKNSIITILASGNITPILEVYQQELGIDFIVGSNPRIENGKIISISQEDYPKEGNFKVVGIKKVLLSENIEENHCVAIGDSRGDLPMFELVNYSIGMNPKMDLSEYVDSQVKDLHQVIELLININSK